MIGSTRKQRPRAPRVKSGLRVLWLVACIMAVVMPRLSADITLVSRLSDARASAQANHQFNNPAPQTQTDFLPAHLSNSANVNAGEGGAASASSTSNSSIVTGNPNGTLRVTGDGSTRADSATANADAQASAKLIVVSFTLTDLTYTYSLTGQLSGNGGVATAKLTSGSSTIFQGVAPPAVTLSQTGTLPPGTYTLSVDLIATAANGIPFAFGTSSGNFTFALDPPPTPTATPSPTPTPGVNISGNIADCSNPVPGPVPNVILTLTGSASGPTQSDASGNYQFSSLASGGSYTVTPTKTALAPGSAGINTVDVLAVQRHFLVLGTPLSGCRLVAADVSGDSAINTVDVLAIQRFFLGRTTGIANVGQYQFTPAARSYPGVVSDQTGQNYDTLTFGDVASPFVGP